MNPWYKDDTFWKTMAPKMFAERPWSNAPSEVDSIVELLEITPGSRILDLCCGPARHTLELARRGFLMTGVDRTASYLDEARKRAEKEKLKVELVQEDMRYFKRVESFDAIINLFTSFGYFEDPEEDRRVVKHMYGSLKPNGKLLIDIMGKEVLARIFQERDWREENGIIFMEERKLSKDWSWIESHWIMLKGAERKEFIISHRLYSGAELSLLLLQCGFRSVELFGSLDKTPYNHNAKRLVALAFK